jgi:heterodisulfide reductase subunit A-like polyferredoxin
LACVQVCKPQAIRFEQRDTFVDLEIGAVIRADGHNEVHQLPKGGGIYQISTHDPLLGSAAAGRSVLVLQGAAFQERKPNEENKISVTNGFKPWMNLPPQLKGDDPNRSGVFICECGDQFAMYIDTNAIQTRATSWPGVIHAQVVPFACSPEGTLMIDTAIETQKLNRVVLAGCACCSIDQICYSCSYQRIRCKDQLKLFTHPERSSALGTIDQAVKFVMVNIREQCAWIHTGNRKKATAKAITLVGASVARAMATPTKITQMGSIDLSALICGNSKAGRHCMAILGDLGIEVHQIPKRPDRIDRSNGMYRVRLNGETWRASALILAPEDSHESSALLSAFGMDRLRLRIRSAWSELETHRPGIYYLSPHKDAAIVGTAGASRTAAWLSRIQNQPALTSVVNPERCRACGTCVDICEFGAPEVVEINHHYASWIDPTICTGCGTCVARCPSGAITAGYSTDSQIEAMLSVMVSKHH